MLRTSGFAILALVLPLASPCWSQELETCTSVHFAETGWTDLALTTETARHVLTALGYETKSDMLGLGIIYESLESGSIDAFLGYWPLAQVEFQPYYDRNAAIVLGDNLENTKFTLAVPTYVADAGVKTFADLARFADRFDKKIYGIGSGAPANISLQEIIKKNDFDLGQWKLIESSEQAMLAEVSRAVKKQKFVTFLGWTPHPMNVQLKMHYLKGGEKYFGDSGQVNTLARKGYAAQCPNVGKLLSNLTFTQEMENSIMDQVLSKQASNDAAIKAWLQANPQVLDGWLQGVKTLDGGDGLAAVKAQL